MKNNSKDKTIKEYIYFLSKVKIYFNNYLLIKNYYNESDLAYEEKVKIFTITSEYSNFFQEYLTLNLDAMILEIYKFFDKEANVSLIKHFPKESTLLFEKHKKTINTIKSVRSTSIAHCDIEKKEIMPSILEMKKLVGDMEVFFKNIYTKTHHSDIGFSVDMSNRSLKLIIFKLYGLINKNKAEKYKQEFDKEMCEYLKNTIGKKFF